MRLPTLMSFVALIAPPMSVIGPDTYRSRIRIRSERHAT
jgi:hypothetical protein